jgi:hypothetical protein
MKQNHELDPLAPRPALDFSKGTRGKYFAQMQQGSNLVVIDEDLLADFPDSEAVNQALRAIRSAKISSAS